MVKKRQYAWLTLAVFFFSIVGPLIYVPTAQATGTTTTIVQQLGSIYQFLDDGDKAAIRTARTNLQGFAATPNDARWNTVLGDLLTAEVIAKYSNDATAARTALINLAVGIGNIQNSTTIEAVTADMDQFKTTYTPTFQKLFGNDITVDELYNFIAATENNLPAVLSTNSAYISACTTGSNDVLVATMPNILKDAMTLALASNTKFASRLSSIGWSVDKLVAQQTQLASIVDPNNNAKLALTKAAVRSKTTLVSGSTTLTAGSTTAVPYGITIMGRPATTLVDWGLSNSNVAVFTHTNSGIPSLTPTAQTGSTILIGYRRGGNPTHDWIIKVPVTVIAGVASSNAKLRGLTSTVGTLVPAFDPAVTSYSMTLPSTQSIMPLLTPVLADANATYTIAPATNLGGTEEQRTATISVLAADGSTRLSYQITFVKNTPITVTTGTTNSVTVTSASQNFEAPVFTAETAASTTLTFDVPLDADKPTVNFHTQPGAAGTVEAILPAVNVSATRSVGTVALAIPANTKVTAPANLAWDGTIVLPTVKVQSSATIAGTVGAVIEVGAGNVPLTFDKAVKLVIPNQTGKSAGFVRNGVMTAINTTWTSDKNEQDYADDHLTATVQEAKINVGNDLVIWTKHFTEFVAYTPTPVPSSGSGSGGGGVITPGTTISSTNGGTVTQYGASIAIPANAFSKDIKVVVAKVDKTGLTVPDNSLIISDVIEITKDKTGDFSKPVTITINFDKSEVDTSKYDLAICWWDTSNSKWVKLDNVKVDLSAGKVSGEVTHFTKFAVIATPKTIVVVLTDIKGHWAEASIQNLVSLGAIKGYPDGSFKPNATITRAEFATALVKAYKLAPKNGTVFSDTANHWAKESIATAAGYGIVNGYTATKFGPDDLITREQMAIMIMKASGLTATAATKTFVDQGKISAWAKVAVVTAANKGIINGYPDNTFAPQGNATRAEAVTVLVKALQLTR